MIDDRYKQELNKLKFIDNNSSNKINEEMYIYRQKLKELILLLIKGNSKIKIVNYYDDIKFIKEYKSYVLKTKHLYPRFIFDEYNKDNFSECIELKKRGYKIEQIEEYYLNELCSKEIGRKYHR